MLLTQNYRLRKPEGTCPVDIKDLNDNADVIDKELAKKADKDGIASDMVTSFAQAASRTNLASGEKLSTSLGKIMKFFTDLKAVAFSGNYNDLSNRPSIPTGGAASYNVANNDTTTAGGFVLDARIGQIHGREIDQIASNLGGNLLIWDGTNFYIQNGNVKKKLGKPDYVDVSVSGWGTYNLSNYISGSYEIVGAGMIHRDYWGWVGFNLTYNATSFTISNLGDAGGTDPHSAIVRVWYY